jgi:hypothetical protein
LGRGGNRERIVRVTFVGKRREYRENCESDMCWEEEGIQREL